MGLGGMLCLQLRQVSYLICAKGTKFVFAGTLSERGGENKLS